MDATLEMTGKIGWHDACNTLDSGERNMIHHLASGYCEIEFEGKFLAVEWKEEEIWHDEYSVDFVVVLENVYEISEQGDCSQLGELPKEYHDRLVDAVYNAARDRCA